LLGYAASGGTSPLVYGRPSYATIWHLYSGKVVGWSMSPVQDRHLVLKAVMMAIWQRTDHTPVILHSDRGTQFTSAEYQQFLKELHYQQNERRWSLWR
jgi:transposase InsO family protein